MFLLLFREKKEETDGRCYIPKSSFAMRTKQNLNLDNPYQLASSQPIGEEEPLIY